MQSLLICLIGAATAAASPLDKLLQRLEWDHLQTEEVMNLQDAIANIKPILDLASSHRRLQGGGERQRAFEDAGRKCQSQIEAWTRCDPPDDVDDVFIAPDVTPAPSQSLATLCAQMDQSFDIVCQFAGTLFPECENEYRAWQECWSSNVCDKDFSCGDVETDDRCGMFQKWDGDKCVFDPSLVPGLDDDTPEETPRPTPRPRPAPRPRPRPAPAPAPAPGDSASWHKKNDPSKDCTFVAKDTAKRCTLKGDGAEYAFEACQASCGAAGAKCEDLDEWYKAGDNTKDCVWASRFINRCAADGWNGKKGYENCKHACKTCDASVPFCSMPCADDDDWHKKNDPSKDCQFVAGNPEKRCTLKGEGAVWAFERCKKTCGGCDAACVDDPTWHKDGDKTKDCKWAKRFVNRCAVDGKGKKGYQACPLSCGFCAVGGNMEEC